MSNLALTASLLCRTLLLFSVGGATWPWDRAIKDPGLSMTAQVSLWGSSVQRGASYWSLSTADPFQAQWFIIHPHFWISTQVKILDLPHGSWHNESLVLCSGLVPYPNYLLRLMVFRWENTPNQLKFQKGRKYLLLKKLGNWHSW